jgi:hypothetical protein
MKLQPFPLLAFYVARIIVSDFRHNATSNFQALRCMLSTSTLLSQSELRQAMHPQSES